MRKLVFALLLLCSALFATAQEWQWSVQLKDSSLPKPAKN